MNLCKDCAHFRNSTRVSAAECRHPELVSLNPLYGYIVGVTAYSARIDDDLCGQAAKRFAPMDAPAPAPLSVPTKHRWWQR